MDIYTIEIYNFLRTVTIKSSFIADQIANTTRNKHNLPQIEDEDNPYYLNMCGLYSPWDSPIYVESIDTNTTVLFSKNLHIDHPRTAERYKIPNKKFDELCSSNPSKKYLIESIVYPVSNINTAIAAKNFDILNYDSSLLQENERDSMIQCLHEVVNLFKTNFYIEEFIYEDLYPVVLWATMWQMMYFYLYNQRIKNIKTQAVHVSHIWNYLTSKGLSDYRSILNINQQYWLYKNLDYLYRNRGKNSNIKLLAENILSTYSVELKQKSVLLNYKDGLEAPEPIPEIISEDIYTNTNPTQNMGVVYESLPTLLNREYSNDLRSTYDIDIISRAHEKFTRTFSTYHPTRVIEINKKLLWLDYESLYIRFILDNYIYRFKEGDLNFKIQVELSGLGSTKLLSVGESLAIFSYCLHLQNTRHTFLEIDIDDVVTPSPFPELMNLPTVPINLPNCAYVDTVFTKGCDPHNVSMNFKGVKYVNVERNLDSLIVIPEGDFTSSDQFMVFLEDKFDVLYHTSMRQRSCADEFFYSVIEAVYNPYVFKGKLDVTFVEGFTTYEAWFNSNAELTNLFTSINKTSNLELEAFMVNLVEKLFPTETIFNIVKSDTILNDKYLKLKKLFMKLCSYTVSFLDTRDDDEINFLTIANVSNSVIDLTNNIEIPFKTTADVSIYITTEIDTPTYRELSKKTFYNDVISEQMVERDNFESLLSDIHLNTFSVRNDIQMDVDNIIIIEDFINITTLSNAVSTTLL